MTNLFSLETDKAVINKSDKRYSCNAFDDPAEGQYTYIVFGWEDFGIYVAKTVGC